MKRGARKRRTALRMVRRRILMACCMTGRGDEKGLR